MFCSQGRCMCGYGCGYSDLWALRPLVMSLDFVAPTHIEVAHPWFKLWVRERSIKLYFSRYYSIDKGCWCFYTIQFYTICIFYAFPTCWGHTTNFERILRLLHFGFLCCYSHDQTPDEMWLFRLNLLSDLRNIIKYLTLSHPILE